MITRISQEVGEGSLAVDMSVVLAAILLVVLLGLLIEVEILRCSIGARARLGVRALQIAVAPLLIAFIVIVAARLATLLGA
jgi:hypothetical protein